MAQVLFNLPVTVSFLLVLDFFESVAVVTGFQDMAVICQSIEQFYNELGIAKYIDPFRNN